MENSDINSEPNPPKQGPLGIQVMESKDGKSRLRLEVQDWHLHSKEDPRVGGGVIMALSDSTAHFAIQSLLEDNELGPIAAGELSHTLLMFDAFHDVAEKASAGNDNAQHVIQSWDDAEWFTCRFKLIKIVCPCNIAVE